MSSKKQEVKKSTTEKHDTKKTSTPSNDTQKGKIGHDGQYFGGKALRAVDRGLQKCGLDRNSAPMRKMHEMEHNRRARIAEKQGDHERAEAERKRAAENRKDKKK